MARIYVETTIPSFYFETRTEPEMVARRNWTRAWWELAFGRDELVTGPAAWEELERGDFPSRQAALGLLAQLPVLEFNDAIDQIAAVYIAHTVMPADPAGDALHLALASYHDCDVLVTWNCRHLANVRKMEHIRRVNHLLELRVPQLLTPLALLGEDPSS